MVTEMTKYDFILLSGDTDAFLERLQSIGVVDITRSTKPIDEQSEKLSHRAEIYRKALAALNTVEPAEFAEKTYGDLAGVHVKPILGCEAYVTSTGDYRSRDKNERRAHLCLHAMNQTGYHNLVRLMSEAHINGFYHNARIDRNLLEKYHEGLHCSSACIAGEVAWAIDKGDMALAEKTARWY